MSKKPDGLSQVKVIRFRYLGKEPGRNIETLPFYINTIRKFLRDHIGDAVWLKGGIIEQPAYLIFKAELTDKVKEILTEELREGGTFQIEPVERPIEIIRKYAHDERVTVGWLKLPNIELGSPQTLYTPEEQELQEKVRAGIMLKDGYTMIRAEKAEIKIVERRMASGGPTEKAPMLILTNCVELLVKDGKIIGVDDKVKPKYGIWLDLIET